MANFESIKAAVQKAEEAAAWVKNAADTVASACPDDCPQPHWVHFHGRAVDQLCDAIEAIARAMYGVDHGSH